MGGWVTLDFYYEKYSLWRQCGECGEGRWVGIGISVRRLLWEAMACRCLMPVENRKRLWGKCRRYNSRCLMWHIGWQPSGFQDNYCPWVAGLVAALVVLVVFQSHGSLLTVKGLWLRAHKDTRILSQCRDIEMCMLSSPSSFGARARHNISSSLCCSGPRSHNFMAWTRGPVLSVH